MKRYLTKIIIFCLGFILLIFNTIACQQQNKAVLVKEKSANNRNYLTQNDLLNYIKQVKPLLQKDSFKSPFDTLIFNKVIAYDFDGEIGGHSSIINEENKTFATSVLKQIELDKTQINYLLDFVTDKKTYGESKASCFIPHFAIIFFHNNSIKYVIDICLDCNYLVSTSVIPATQISHVFIDDTTSYALNGFSNYGKGKVIDLSKMLNLRYGLITK